MRTRCKYNGASRTMDGDLIISFIAEEGSREKLEQMPDDLEMIVSEYKKKKSLTANNYFWMLCGKIAEKIGSDKDTVYLMKLSEYSSFEAYDIPEEAIKLIEDSEAYRLIEVDHRYTMDILSGDDLKPLRMAEVHCWKGSHTFNTAQMSRLIAGTVEDARELGIETMTPDEISHLCAIWKEHK